VNARLSAAVIADLLLHGGAHQYLSTYCLHARHQPGVDDGAVLHAACSAESIHRAGSVVPRDPAQCKVCSEPCVCECHTAALTADSLAHAASRVLTDEDLDTIAEEAAAKRRDDR
jgi:hypothetical protein